MTPASDVADATSPGIPSSAHARRSHPAEAGRARSTAGSNHVDSRAGLCDSATAPRVIDLSKDSPELERSRRRRRGEARGAPARPSTSVVEEAPHPALPAPALSARGACRVDADDEVAIVPPPARPYTNPPSRPGLSGRKRSMASSCADADPPSRPARRRRFVAGAQSQAQGQGQPSGSRHAHAHAHAPGTSPCRDEELAARLARDEAVAQMRHDELLARRLAEAGPPDGPHMSAPRIYGSGRRWGWLPGAAEVGPDWWEAEDPVLPTPMPWSGLVGRGAGGGGDGGGGGGGRASEACSRRVGTRSARRWVGRGQPPSPPSGLADGAQGPQGPGAGAWGGPPFAVGGVPGMPGVPSHAWGPAGLGAFPMGAHLGSMAGRLGGVAQAWARGLPGARARSSGLRLEELLGAGVAGRRAEHLRLLLTDRDFDEGDYEALLRLDEAVESRRGATREEIERMGSKEVAGGEGAGAGGEGGEGGGVGVGEDAPLCTVCLDDIHRRGGGGCLFEGGGCMFLMSGCI